MPSEFCQPGVSCLEGVYRFQFDAGYLVCRSECSPFYSRHAQNFCNSCKEMDFMLYHPGKKELWLIEVKDYRFNARPKVQDLVEKLCRKVRDCLFLLRTAALCAPEEEPAEGISLREMARLSLQAKHIRIAFTIELGGSAFYPAKSLLAHIRDLLYRQIRFIDPQMICLPITESGGIGPWRIFPAGNEHSARIKKRIEEAQLACERTRRQAAAERKQTRRKNHKTASIPLWKLRALERESGACNAHRSRHRNRAKS